MILHVLCTKRKIFGEFFVTMEIIQYLRAIIFLTKNKWE